MDTLPFLKIPGGSETINPAEDEDQAALRFAAAGDAALCTIVGIHGSFSRRLGAQFTVRADGAARGSLSDGCLERELVTQAREARREGAPRLLRYGQGSPVIDFRLPCGSGLDILVDPAPDVAALAAAIARLDARVPAVLTLPVGSPDLLQRRSYIPAMRMLVLGEGAEAAELAALASAFGLALVVRNPGESLALGQPPRGLDADPWTAIILLFHDHEWEGALLDWALGTQAFYIGVQGGKVTRESRAAALAARGHGAGAISRVVSPVGLIPRARDPRVLALSVLAETVGCYECLRGSHGDGPVMPSR